MRQAFRAPRPRRGQPLALLSAAALAAASFVASPVSPATAAPLPATYTATASGDVLTVGSTLVGAPLAEVDLVHSAASVDSSHATAPSSATSANLGVQLGGLVGQTDSNTETAPASHTESGSLATISQLGLSAGLLTYTDTVNWAGATACVADGTPISSATTSTAGAELTLLGQEVLSTGVASVTGTTTLDQVSATNDTRAVVASATGSIADLSILNGLATVAVLDAPTLTATATGTATGSSVTFTPAAAQVTIGGTTTTLTAGADVTLALPGGAGSITLHLASAAEVTGRTVAADGTSASGDAIALSLSANLTEPLTGAALGSVDLDLLPLHAEATAPTGGVECAAAAPTIAITAPADGSSTADPTPAITGTTNQPNSTVTLVIDGGTPVEVTTDADGNFTYTPTTALAPGSHTVEATVANASGASASDSTTFTVTVVAPTVTITAPEDGSTTTDRTPDITGTSNQPDSTLILVIDGGDPVEVTTDADGNFTYTPTADLDCGEHEVTVTAENSAGTATDTTSFTIDCPAGGSGDSGDGNGGLAYTGVNLAALLLTAALLIAMGVGLVAARRRGFTPLG